MTALVWSALAAFKISFCFWICASAQSLYKGPAYLATAMNTLRRQKATTVSSFMTYTSLLMAAMERPAPAERIAVLDTRELPGRASMIDWAFVLGSSLG